MIRWIRAEALQRGLDYVRVDENRRLEVALLGGIILIAVALRFYRLGDWSMWIDEIYTLGRVEAHYSNLQAALDNIPPGRNWFPISLLLTSGLLEILGTSAWSARLASAIIGIVTVPALYILAKRLFDGRTALFAALFLALSTWHLTWSQNARFYTAVMLFFFLALVAIYFGLERNRTTYILWGLVLFYLAASERIFALFLVPVVACYLLCLWLLPFEKPAGLNRKNLLILSLPLVAGVVIEGASLLTAGVSRFFGDFGWFFLYRNYTPLRLLAAITFSIGPVLMGVALCGSYDLLRQKSRQGLMLSIMAILPILLLLPLSPFIFTQDRYVFVTLPAWIILAAVAVNAVWTRLRAQHAALAIALAVALIADAAESNALYYRAYDGNRLEWRSAFGLVRERATEEDVVVAYWPEFGPYYLDRDIIAWDDITVEDLVQINRRVWFVVDSETVWGDLHKKDWIERNAQLVEVLYLRTPENQYLRVYLYDPASVSGAPQD